MNTARAWRDGTEVPADTVFRHGTVTVVFGCDNECPRLAQLVLDEWADSMGREAPRLVRRHLHNHPAEPWPKDFQALFDDPGPPLLRRTRRRRLPAGITRFRGGRTGPESL